MNKLKLLEIMRQLILLYKQGLLTSQSYQEVVNSIPTPTLTEDLISYKETELICFLFKEIPYYQILTFLNSLCIELNRIRKEEPQIDTKNTLPLIVAYFSDLFNNINGRVSTEVNVHIYRLLLNYYQKGTLNPKREIASLKQNCCNPEALTGLFIAGNLDFEQITLLGFEEEKGILREKISRSNYNKRSSVENAVQKIIIKFFDEESFEKFLQDLQNCFNSYHEENPKDCDVLRDEILMQLTVFFQKSQKAWNTQKKTKEEPGYQYKLF